MMEDIQINSSTDASDIEGSAFTMDSKYKKGGQLSVYPDPVADQLMQTYSSLGLAHNEALRYSILASPLGLILAFYILISSSTSALICFIAWTFSVVFIGISLYMLCEILNKDQGPRGM